MTSDCILVDTLLALSIAGSPVQVRNFPIILPLTRNLNFSNGTIDLVQHDKARVAALKDYHTNGRRAESIPMAFGGGKYIAALGVGSPSRIYTLIVDTGSSVTWIGASTPYKLTGTSVNTRQGVEEIYGARGPSVTSFSGTIFRDTVTLGSGLTIPDYELAVASTSRNIGYDGILGLGPRYLTVNTLTDDPTETYPTFTDCLVNAGAISHNLIGIFFQPITGDRGTDVGELSFGGVDYTKFTGTIVFTYWGIDQSITYGNTVILFHTAGIIDTGSTFIKIASDAYDKYQAATGATFDQPTGLLRITSDQYNALRDLKFHISDHGHTHCHGLDFIAGYTFMQRFYTVLDGDNVGVAFATTPFTGAITN
ncbi:aspartic peptidase domain-containing protein [Suillus spraguei]|nr:aspartic peptidase domain-containing protein [Suillus spraguei]